MGDSSLKGNYMASYKIITADRCNAHVQVSNGCNSCLSYNSINDELQNSKLL